MGADTRESRGYSSLSLTLLKPWEKKNNNNVCLNTFNK